MTPLERVRKALRHNHRLKNTYAVGVLVSDLAAILLMVRSVETLMDSREARFVDKALKALTTPEAGT